MNRSRAVFFAAIALVLALALGLWLWPSDESAGPAGEQASSSESAGTAGRGSKAGGKLGGAAYSDLPGATRRAPSEGGPRIEATWGSGGDQLGRLRPEGGNPEGPMSFTLAPNGEIWVLDQVNGRIVRYGKDGKVRGSFQTSQQYPQDIAIAKDGSALVLDRLTEKAIAVYDPAGNLRTEIPLVGPNLDEPEGVTGVFTDGDDIYAEKEHGDLVLVGSTDGKVNTEQPTIPGRPSADGHSFVTTAIVDPPAAGRILVASIDRATMSQRFTRVIGVGLPVAYLSCLDTDARGTIYLAAVLELPAAAAPGDAEIVEPPLVLRLICLSPTDGTVLGSADLPVSMTPEETFRDLQALPEGGVLYAYRTETGVSYQTYHCQ